MPLRSHRGRARRSRPWWRPRSRRGWLPTAFASVITAAVAGEAPLAPGAALPSIDAQTLDGNKTKLPKDGSGHALVIVVGFTKAAAKDTMPWLEACRNAAAAAESAPSAAAGPPPSAPAESARSAATGSPPGAPAPSSPGLVCYDVRMVEDVPRLFRRLMERDMKSGFPPGLQQRTLLVYEHNEAWRGRLGVDDDRTAHVIGCDAEGIVRAVARGPYSQKELKTLLETIARPPTTS